MLSGPQERQKMAQPRAWPVIRKREHITRVRQSNVQTPGQTLWAPVAQDVAKMKQDRSRRVRKNVAEGS